MPDPTTGDAPGTRPEPPADLTGRTLGDFQVLRRIGSGGMGQVYLARQLSLKREVVLAEHVVQVEAGARNDHARSGPVGCRQRGRIAVGVDGGDVRGSRCAYGLGLARLAGLDSRDGAVDVREEALGQPAAVQVAEEAAAPRPRLLAHHLGEPHDRPG